MDNRSQITIKLDALQRLVMNNTLSGILPLYIITEYPKSGGSWLGSMLSEYMDIPFPRNKRPDFTSSIIHGHMLPTPFMKNVTCLYRDGRDVMVSLYYHMLFVNDKNSPILVSKTKKALNFNDVNDIKSNLPSFIKYIHKVESSSISPYKFTWDEFANNWLHKNVNHIKYEDLISDCFGTMKILIENITHEVVDEENLNTVIDKYSFQNQTKRMPGEEDVKSFIRKGQPGDWKEKFTKESAAIFNNLYRNEMIKLGYVSDDSWVDEIIS